MERPTVRFMNEETNEQENRPMTDAEFAEYQKQVAEFAPDKEPTIVEKLASVGLTIADLKAALA